jgi:NitT/TauT family transport system ATP-binding protein
MSEILKLKNVSLTYQTRDDEIHAIKNLSFYCNEGDFISIIGPSGCGKTTILSLIAGLIPATSGEIELNGKRNNKEFEIGYMLQKDHLFPWRTIERNIFLPLEIKGKKDEKHRARALALAEKYGLKQFLKSYPAELSGGMRQRVALIRTLALDPDILLLDEPFSALDYQTRLSVCDDVYKIIRSERKTALLITHDISEAISVADRILVLSQRPATVVAAHNISFPENEPLKRRENKEFSKWFELLWKELNV